MAEEVIGTWCDILNLSERYRSRESPLRLFLSDKTNVSLLYFQVDSLDIDLIFLNYVSYICVYYIFRLIR